MLYLFEKLSVKLSELGYPESQSTGFKIIKRDLTLEESEGNIEYKSDGIYLKIDGKEYKGYMYLKSANIGTYGYPKFHITNCQTIIQQKNQGSFDGRYFWHNSNTVTIQDRGNNGEVHKDVCLALCNYCRAQANIIDYDDTTGFFYLLDNDEREDINKEYEVDIFGYTLDWQKISTQYRKEKEYTCEKCGIKIEVQSDRRFIHVHHRNGDKLNNSKSNLECLCILCHSNVDINHEHNFERRNSQKGIKIFVNNYKDELLSCGNVFVKRYL